jgi:hypothetical protein
MSELRTVKLIDRTTGYVFDAYLREGEEVDFSIFTNEVDFADAPEILDKTEGKVVLEPGAVLTPTILAKLATIPAPTPNRRAVVSANGAVSYEVWHRVKDYGGIEFGGGENVYRWAQHAKDDPIVHSSPADVVTAASSPANGAAMSKVDSLRERMSAIVREAQDYGQARAREPLRIASRTGPLQLVESIGFDWSRETPTYLADGMPVSEGVGNRNGAVFAFWIGDRDPGSPAVVKAMTEFIADHDVVGVKFIRALPVEVHAGIRADWEAAKATSAGGNKRQLFVDDRGHMVQVKTMGIDTVEYHNQGGGYGRTMPRADFEKQYAPAEEPSYAPVTITAEWLDDDARLPAYSNGLVWNGWAVPHFEKDAAMRLIEMMPGMRYDAERDAFISRDEGYDEDDVYEKVTILVGDKSVDTYPIGAGSWCWETAQEEPEAAPPARMRM